MVQLRREVHPMLRLHAQCIMVLGLPATYCGCLTFMLLCEFMERTVDAWHSCNLKTHLTSTVDHKPLSPLALPLIHRMLILLLECWPNPRPLPRFSSTVWLRWGHLKNTYAIRKLARYLNGDGCFYPKLLWWGLLVTSPCSGWRNATCHISRWFFFNFLTAYVFLDVLHVLIEL